MLKNALLTAVLSVMTINCFSQYGYIAVSVGPSIPIGEFASKDASRNAAGFAKTGAIFDVNFRYKLGQNFGLSVLLRVRSNNIDNEAYANELANQTGLNWTVDSKAWSTGGFMFGGYGSFPISDKISFDTRAMIGFLKATSPEINITLDGSGGAAGVKQSSASATVFSYLIGGGFRFDVGSKVCLLANLDYMGAKPEFMDVQITTSPGSIPQKAKFIQKMETINFGFGVGLRF